MGLPEYRKHVMKLFDTHMHLTDKPFSEKIFSVLEKAESSGVTTILVPSYSRQSCDEVIDIKYKIPQLKTALALHPLFDIEYKDTENFLRRRLNDFKPDAIGETGIDLRPGAPDLTEQISRFEQHLNIAHEYELPVIIHCVKAHEQCIETLKKMQHTLDGKPISYSGIIHRVSCSIEQAREYIKLGFHFGLGPDIFYRNRKKIRNLARELPENRIVLETDAPYSQNSSGKPAGPWDLADVLEDLADLRETNAESLSSVIYKNSTTLFRKTQHD